MYNRVISPHDKDMICLNIRRAMLDGGSSLNLELQQDSKLLFAPQLHLMPITPRISPSHPFNIVKNNRKVLLEYLYSESKPAIAKSVADSLFKYVFKFETETMLIWSNKPAIVSQSALSISNTNWQELGIFNASPLVPHVPQIANSAPNAILEAGDSLVFDETEKKILKKKIDNKNNKCPGCQEALNERLFTKRECYFAQLYYGELSTAFIPCEANRHQMCMACLAGTQCAKCDNGWRATLRRYAGCW